MQAILCKYLGPTDRRGSRVKAVCASGSVTLGFDDALGFDGNYEAAANALIAKLGWDKDWHTQGPYRLVLGYPYPKSGFDAVFTFAYTGKDC
jgi:hypothetical protein